MKQVLDQFSKMISEAYGVTLLFRDVTEPEKYETIATRLESIGSSISIEFYYIRLPNSPVSRFKPVFEGSVYKDTIGQLPGVIRALVASCEALGSIGMHVGYDYNDTTDEYMFTFNNSSRLRLSHV